MSDTFEHPRESERERRRYALLQAAAYLMRQGNAYNPVSEAVDMAEQLLAEIERREREG